MFVDAVLPTIPRLLSAIAEWLSCACILRVMEHRFQSPAVRILLNALFGGVMILAHYLCCLVLNMERFTGLIPWAVGMAGCMLLMLLYMRVVSSSDGSTILGCWSFAFVTAEFIAALAWEIAGGFLQSTSLRDPGTFLLVLAVLFVMLTITDLLERRICGGLIRMDHRVALAFLLMALTAMVMSNVGFFQVDYVGQEDLSGTLSAIRSLIDFAVIACMMLIQSYLREKTSQMETAELDHVLQLQYQQYRDYVQSSEYISRQCHDLKHQIQALRLACTEEERESSLQNMEKAIQVYDAQNITGNPVTDTILTRKKRYCSENRIQFLFTGDGQDAGQISVKDLCTILGNLTDNAIECVIQYEAEEDRVIVGEIGRRNQFLMIRMENCYHGTWSGEGLPETTKSDRHSHGYGLKSIAYTAEKYGGSLRISAENGWFCAKVLLPLR